MSILNKTRIINKKIENFFCDKIHQKFDIFFLDPPFSSKEFIYNLKLIKKNKIYNKEHLLIIHREKKTYDFLNDLIDILDIKIYGRSKIIFGLFF